MTAPTSARRRPLPNLKQATFESIFGHVYALLMVNLMLAAANAPLLVFATVSADPVAAWPFFLLLALTAAPSIAAAHGVFHALRDGSTTPVRDFWRGYARAARRATAIGAAALAILGVCLADLSFLAGSSAGELLTPLLCVIAATTLATGFAVLAGTVLLPDLALRRLLVIAFGVSVRHWYFAILNVACLAGIAAAVLVQPVLGTLLAPSLLLFLAWSNTHFAFVAAATRQI